MISIVIPMYNAEKSIIRSLNSIKNQTFPEKVEIIVVNDGSTDESKSLVEKYIKENPNLEITLISTINRGVSAARNTGMKKAKYEYIASLDSDDAWHPVLLEKQFNILRNYPSIDLVGSIIRKKPFRLYFFRNASYLIRVSLNEIMFHFYFSPSTILFKKIILEKSGYYPENQKFAEEGNFIMKIIYEKFNCFLINECLSDIGINNKKPFGESGLSGNLDEMQKGEILNHKFAYKNLSISILIYYLARFYSTLKYLRRIIIVKIFNVNK